MPYDAHQNLAVANVLTAPSPAASGTSLVVGSGQGARFSATPFNATVWPSGVLPDPTNAKIVRVTAIVSDTLTIVRAQEGTSARTRSEEHTSELQSQFHLVCRLLLEKKKKKNKKTE